MNIFHQIIKEKIDKFWEICVDKGALVSLLCRKLSVLLAASGCTVSPPTPSIYLIFFWIMVLIKDSYLKYEKVGHQFIGNSVMGI